ncbi:DUF2336 domain-containing protein [Brevundimonas sp.]|uniref:DUF2336 domain-containing protein n=1 Tax=Brevundimonas sp. TaxID=1871086 RepID=UPI002D2E9C78|nr:DUF2336 domain-containing protein [Brevundimonas sp.]HYC74602.1 DUF2336 domain-containing protein [Brevundimonas sp.]
MGAAVRAQDLISLAHSRQAGDRERLLLAVTDLCDGSPDSRRPEVQSLLDNVFMALVVEAERDIRRALAERLAEADWAPKALVNVLALDEIDIARPIIAKSPLLRDQDLIRLLIEATIEHQIEVARRPALSARVVDAVIDRAEPAVLTALVGNPSAEITEGGMRRLVESSRRIAALRSPLARHPKLTRLLAEQLYGWVGQALRTAIADRFRIDSDALDQAIAEAVRAAQSGQSGEERQVLLSRDGEREEMERRLIAKLEAAGQLRPGYLVRALKERKLSLFENALAALGGFSITDVRSAIDAPSPEPLALACAAVGIDRVVFPTVLSLVRELNAGRPYGSEAGRAILSAFGTPVGVAADHFRQAIAGGASARV